MKITRIIVALILLLVAAGLAQWIVYVRNYHDVGRRIFGGAQTFSHFRSASVITAQRLHWKDPGGSMALADYTREPPVRLSEQQASELKRIFSDRSSYWLDLWTTPAGQSIVTTCLPHYGILFATDSVPPVQIAICFVCDQFAVFVGEGDTAKDVNDDDRLTVMRPSLVALAKSIYPNDSQIQSLKPERD